MLWTVQIAALRYSSEQSFADPSRDGEKFVVGTTSIITGDSLLRNLHRTHHDRGRAAHF